MLIVQKRDVSPRGQHEAPCVIQLCAYAVMLKCVATAQEVVHEAGHDEDARESDGYWAVRRLCCADNVALVRGRGHGATGYLDGDAWSSVCYACKFLLGPDKMARRAAVYGPNVVTTDTSI